MRLLQLARTYLRGGRPADVIALKDSLLQLTGTELAEAHVLLLYTHLTWGSCGADWHAALFHGRALLRLHPPGHPIALWALEQMACAANLLRAPLLAERYGRAFFAHPTGDPALQATVPYVWKHLGVAALCRGRLARAVQCLQIALPCFEAAGDAVMAGEVSLLLALVCYRAGRLREAERQCPPEPPPRRLLQWHAVRALLAYGRRNYEEASTEALAVLNSSAAGERDGLFRAVYGGAALLVLAGTARAAGARDLEATYRQQALRFETRQGRNAAVRLVLSLRGKGGDLRAPEASRGSGDYHPDARLTTGVG
jgi:hypothetical protein